VTLGNASVADVYMAQDSDATVHCGSLTDGTAILTGGALTGVMRDVSTTTTVLTESGSGMVLVPNTEARTFTLPAISSIGVYFTFIVGDAFSASHTIETYNSGSEAKLTGWIMYGSGSVTRTAFDDKTSISTSTSVTVGDRIDIISDGSQWLVSGHLNANISLI
jgi:hypothetical protein